MIIWRFLYRLFLCYVPRLLRVTLSLFQNDVAQSSIWLFVSGEIQNTNSCTIFSVPWMEIGTIDHSWNVIQGTNLKSIHIMQSLKPQRCLTIEQTTFSCVSWSSRKATGYSSVCSTVCDSTVIIKLSTQYVSMIVSCVYYHWKDCNSYFLAL